MVCSVLFVDFLSTIDKTGNLVFSSETKCMVFVYCTEESKRIGDITFVIMNCIDRTVSKIAQCLEIHHN